MIKNKKSIRLPSHISPIHYKIEIKPDLESSTFSGSEVITIKILADTNSITLHSKDIDIETVKYIKNKKKDFATKITYDPKKETTTFYFKNKIEKGTGKISMIFSGVIKENLSGLYKSKYVLNGEDKYLTTTQFESTDARRAFPCFDEPAHKAVFEISLIIPTDHTAISNTMPIDIKEHGAGYKIVSFSPSPIMSTYLLAFIAGEFESIEGKTKDGVQVRVFTTNGKTHQAKFALDTAIKCVEFYNEYFDIPYPMPNLDLITIPNFEAAGMENWGAITFREAALLVDEEHSSIANKQWVAIVIAHEIAHQWFGNLVTMHWWTDLWLNEGFASYMEKYCVDKLFPHWNIWNFYLANDRYRIAIIQDSLKNSHPIEIEVHHPDEISEAFDMLSYEKGPVIIRMLSNYLGEDLFKEGLRYYLKKHSYKNTETIHLWDAFEKVSRKPIKKIMNSWTKQMGFPLLKISNKKSDLYLAQERFFSSRISRKNNKNKSLWQIPVSYNIPNKNENIQKTILLNKKQILLPEKFIGKVNTNESSFLKVHYDKTTLDYLKQEIIKGLLPSSDRLGIIRDLIALAEGGYIKTSEVFEFSLAYRNEKEFIVWSELSYAINKLWNIIKGEKFADKYKRYALSLFSPIAKEITFYKKQKEKHSDGFLRNLVIAQSAFYGDKDIIKEAKKIFANRLIKPIDADIRETIYNIVAQNGGEKEWKIFKDLYTKEVLQEEKGRYMRALGYFKNKELLSKTLSLALSKEVLSQDAPFLIAVAWKNQYGQSLTWQFLKKNWKTILKNYGEGGYLLSRMMEVSGNHTTLKDLKDFKKFFKNNAAPASQRTIIQSYERIESNIAWLKDDKKDIETWLNKNF